MRVKQLTQTGIFGSIDEYKKEVDRLTAASAGGSETSAKALADLLRLQETYAEYFDHLALIAEEELSNAKDLLDRRMEAAQAELAFHTEVLNNVKSLYSGSISWMNSIEKAGFLGAIAEAKLEAGDSQGYFDTLYAQLEAEKRMSVTLEDYKIKFEKGINDMKSFEPKATTDDVVKTLMDILNATIDTKEAIQRASYQGVL